MKPFNVIGSGINYPSERTRAFTVLAVIALHCELSRGLVVIASELGKFVSRFYLDSRRAIKRANAPNNLPHLYVLGRKILTNKTTSAPLTRPQ